MIVDRGHNLFYFKGITGVTLTAEAVRMWFPWAVMSSRESKCKIKQTGYTSGLYAQLTVS